MSREITWQDISYKQLRTILTDCWNFIILRTIQYTKDAVEHLILFSILYTILCILLYSGIVRWRLFQFKSDVKNPKRVLIVTAHPDDECMFFGPTILNFTRQNSLVYIMCLSTGTLRSVRKNELYKACKILGINESMIMVHNHTDLPDKIDIRWPTDLVAKLILNGIEMYNINTLITFDKYGVSQHFNHCSIYYAIARLSLERRIPKDCTVYVLETVNIIRKYWLFLDIPLSYLLSRTRYLVCYSDRVLIHKAMKQHRSQLVWFRRLYMLFSRYMLVNTLQKMDLSDIELDLVVDD